MYPLAARESRPNQPPPGRRPSVPRHPESRTTPSPRGTSETSSSSSSRRRCPVDAVQASAWSLSSPTNSDREGRSTRNSRVAAPHPFFSRERTIRSAQPTCSSRSAAQETAIRPVSKESEWRPTSMRRLSPAAHRPAYVAASASTSASRSAPSLSIRAPGTDSAHMCACSARSRTMDPSRYEPDRAASDARFASTVSVSRRDSSIHSTCASDIIGLPTS